LRHIKFLSIVFLRILRLRCDLHTKFIILKVFVKWLLDRVRGIRRHLVHYLPDDFSTIVEVDGIKHVVNKIAPTWQFIFMHEYFIEPLMKNLAKGKIFIDVGAGIGYWIVKLGKYYKHALAIEPDLERLKILKENVKLNNLEGKVELVDRYCGTCSECVSLNDLLSRFIHEDVFVKIDVEGSELDVVASGQEMLKKFKNIDIIVECHGTENYQEICNFLKNLGFDVVKIYELTKENIYIYASKQLYHFS